ncbi:aminotransferase class III-fold pyridoxal phosphate-dependent enzyme [Kitasatospora purpeofusca]|uniref:aspartate aminotransferase family protein n=1 Tax=Kitasatospora purpeofusca TaxID=67352 RepID=UPI0022565850|nr:aminotransferase class III-fold pyridoxal phosphate-dependent enzyme [Kitasatospora purpeofusca]MCX4690682.1 aminotransferase class III-fold pyridoxal phosphate-dependent enzyme [Kitasatospora purpeofusca]
MTEPTDPSYAKEIADGYRKHLSRGRAALAEATGNLVEVASDGAYVWDSNGRPYLDCGGYGVFILGHRHPKVVEAVSAQLRQHPLSTRLLLDPVALRAAEALVGTTPPGLDYVHFVNSGAEANEAAIKLARAHGKTNLVSAHGGYHGKTMGALSLTARALYQDPFRPLLPDVHHVPFGDAEALRNLLAQTPDCCVVLEPVQGENGVILPPPGYLREVENACRAHNALLVLDEVQTGLGRLGTWWGADREDVVPDILLVGKGLSGGVIPVAAMVATATAYAPFNRDPFIHTSTFGASPIACAAAEAAVETLWTEGLVERGAAIGARLIDGLDAILTDTCPHLVKEVRGAGLLIGIELIDERIAGEFVLELVQAGLLVNHSLNSHRVIRLTPAATLSDDDIDLLFARFHQAATSIAATHTATVERNH